MDITRLVIVFVLIGIVVSMASALRQLTRSDGGDSGKMLRALTVRVGLSVGLFVVLLVAWQLGLIKPHGVAG